jgi:hypothetical protein
VSVQINGKVRRLSQLELIIRTIIHEAAKGKRRATRLSRELQGIVPLDEPPIQKGVFIVPEPASSYEEWFERYAPSEVKGARAT